MEEGITKEQAFNAIKESLEIHGFPLFRDGPGWLESWILADTWEGLPRARIFAAGGYELDQLCTIIKGTGIIALMASEKGLKGLDAAALQVIDNYLGLTPPNAAKTRLCTGP